MSFKPGSLIFLANIRNIIRGSPNTGPAQPSARIMLGGTNTTFGPHSLQTWTISDLKQRTCLPKKIVFCWKIVGVIVLSTCLCIHAIIFLLILTRLLIRFCLPLWRKTEWCLNDGRDLSLGANRFNLKSHPKFCIFFSRTFWDNFPIHLHCAFSLAFKWMAFNLKSQKLEVAFFLLFYLRNDSNFTFCTQCHIHGSNAQVLLVLYQRSEANRRGQLVWNCHTDQHYVLMRPALLVAGRWSSGGTCPGHDWCINVPA